MTNAGETKSIAPHCCEIIEKLRAIVTDNSIGTVQRYEALDALAERIAAMPNLEVPAFPEAEYREWLRKQPVTNAGLYPHHAAEWAWARAFDAKAANAAIV